MRLMFILQVYPSHIDMLFIKYYFFYKCSYMNSFHLSSIYSLSYNNSVRLIINDISTNLNFNDENVDYNASC